MKKVDTLRVQQEYLRWQKIGKFDLKFFVGPPKCRTIHQKENSDVEAIINLVHISASKMIP